MQLITDPEVLEGYLTDASNLPGHADGLYRPKSTAELAAILKHCQSENIAVTITAARTATTGSAVPEGGVLVSMEAFNDVLDIEHDTATALHSRIAADVHFHVLA